MKNKNAAVNKPKQELKTRTKVSSNSHKLKHDHLWKLTFVDGMQRNSQAKQKLDQSRIKLRSKQENTYTYDWDKNQD